MSRKILNFTGILSLLILFFLPALALAEGDDFNDNTKDPTKWGKDRVFQHGSLTETDGRLEFRTTRKDSWVEVDRPWIRSRGSFSGNWEVQIDLTNTVSPTGNYRYCDFGVGIMSSRTYKDQIYASLYAATSDVGTVTRAFSADVEKNWNSAGSAAVVTLATSGAIKVAFDGTTKVATVSYAIDIGAGYSWVPYASFGLAGSGGTDGNTDWGLTDNDHLVVYVFGYAERLKIGAGEIYGDNFVETGLVTPGAASVSEGTVGTEFSITGSYFGDKKGKVYIGTALADITVWETTVITGTVKNVKLPAKLYDITITPKPYALAPSISLIGAFTAKAPDVVSVVPDNGLPKTDVTITGNFFGTKKGLVYLEYEKGGKTKKQYCTVKSWTMDAATGASTIVFSVPKGLSPGAHPIYLSNKVGTSAPGTSFTINATP